MKSTDRREAKNIDRDGAGRAPRRRLTPADREAQIVRAAVTFFAQHGLEAQTRELAEEVGVTHALLFHYFPTKQRLIDRVYEEVYAGRWRPEWEALLDSDQPPVEKVRAFYDDYVATMLTSEWVRILVHSGIGDHLIPDRYFGLLQQKLFPRLVRESRRAYGIESRAKPTVRETAHVMGLHGGLAYLFGLWPHIYGQEIPGAENATETRHAVVKDRVEAYFSALPGVWSDARFAQGLRDK